MGTPHNGTGAFPGKEVGGVQALAGLAPSSQLVGSLTLAGVVGQKNWANSELSKFTSMEKYT